jgi:hypothetical protein
VEQKEMKQQAFSSREAVKTFLLEIWARKLLVNFSAYLMNG